MRQNTLRPRAFEDNKKAMWMDYGLGGGGGSLHSCSKPSTKHVVLRNKQTNRESEDSRPLAPGS